MSFFPPTPVLHERDWITFLTNGRPNCYSFCVIWCEAFFEGIHSMFYFRQGSNYNEHAEFLTINKLMDAEEIRRTHLRKVTLYCSYSPCKVCAYQLVQFVEKRPHMTLTLVFTSLYVHEVIYQREGLRCLAMQRGVSMRVVRSGDWAYLTSLREKKIWLETKEEVTRREAWDSLWSGQLTMAVANNVMTLLSIEMMHNIVEMRVQASNDFPVNHLPRLVVTPAPQHNPFLYQRFERSFVVLSSSTNSGFTHYQFDQTED